MTLQNSFMAKALAQARLAAQNQEVPVGAVLVHEDHIISAFGNEICARKDPTAHAELLCIRQAAQKLGTERLTQCDLYATLEPCPMCAQAISFARIKCLYFGAYDPKGGGVEHGPRIFAQPTCHHRPELIGGVQEQACAQLLKEFFATKRIP